MASPVTSEIRPALLLAALEPAAPRGRIERALVLLGRRAATVDAALRLGLLREVGGRILVIDARVAQVVSQRATERERRMAHLALACCGPRNPDRDDGRASFDSLSAQLDRPASQIQDLGLPLTLTPQERRVAQLAATGARTCEIAHMICLSQKTVEYHLTRIYRKLGVRSKAELASSMVAG